MKKDIEFLGFKGPFNSVHFCGLGEEGCYAVEEISQEIDYARFSCVDRKFNVNRHKTIDYFEFNPSVYTLENIRFPDSYTLSFIGNFIKHLNKEELIFYVSDLSDPFAQFLSILVDYWARQNSIWGFMVSYIPPSTENEKRFKAIETTRMLPENFYIDPDETDTDFSFNEILTVPPRKVITKYLNYLISQIRH